MKKVMLFILAVLLVLPVFSQANPMSILYAYTGGLFQNLFDLEFQPTATFGGTEADLLFAGLGNPGFEQALDTSLSGNLELGYYQHGAMPLDCRRDGDPGLSCELRARWIHLYPAEQDSFLTSRSTVPQPTFTQLPPIVPYSMRAICAPCSARSSANGCRHWQSQVSCFWSTGHR